MDEHAGVEESTSFPKMHFAAVINQQLREKQRRVKQMTFFRSVSKQVFNS